MEKLIDRILSISKKLKLSHLGSNLSVLPILLEIYEKKEPNDIVGLSGAHSHLAHLLVMEQYYDYGEKTPEELIEEFGIHCDRKAGCDISGGSLTHSGIALGMALADRTRTAYWIETDGSLQEGEAWETLRIKEELKLDNLKVICNLNGYTALAKIDRDELSNRLRAFSPSIDIRYTNNYLPELDSVSGHYTVL